ncbi:MAG: T9SS type A sorting domain-containing protein [Marinilabiliaceae bacterium]|nr:T9SS type A sorting domain-containing protein [Marinilabiliaceae bacterium]
MEKKNFYFKTVRKQMLMLMALMFAVGNLLAIDLQTVDSVSNQTITLSDAVEYHITNANNAITNSTISLNHEDAWLFFDNVRPSEVVSKYKSSILINGTAFTPETNGRVAIYKNGTAILPFGASYKPLTVYTEPSYAGYDTSFVIHTYHKALGRFNNAIQSMKLKRGYMATLANNADGSGYSRVFIADTEDLLIENLPSLLNGKVSFIRVFKHQWVSKKGKAGWNPDDINGTCYYDWNIGGNSSYNFEYAAIRQNAGWPGWDAINSKENITHLLGFNEPDRPDQSNMAFDDALAQWPDFMKSGLRLGSPATSDPFNSWSLINFVDACDANNYRLDFVAVHCYWVKTPTQWYNDLKYIHERTGRPIWITEWNNGANWTTETWPTADRSYSDANALKQLNDITKILEVLDTAHFVERYFIYDWVQDCRAMVLSSGLTLAGKYYAANKSDFAYSKKNDVIPGWNTKAPTLTTTYSQLTNNIAVEWNDPNGELSISQLLQRKLFDGSFEDVYNSENGVQSSLTESAIDGNYGTISFRLKIQGVDGISTYSNLSKYHKIVGSGTFQVGKLGVREDAWEPCVFENPFNAIPVVILGPTSYNNSFPYAKRVKNVSAKSIELHLDPWVYLDGPKFSVKLEDMAALSVLPGVYNWGGLKAIAGSKLSVSDTWKAVTFTEAFDTIPAVFCTQVTTNTLVPTEIAIRNVTKTGFEVRLLKEATSTSSVSYEKINFLAVEPGNGVVDGKNLVVYLSETEDVGNYYNYKKIDIPDTYSEPVLFANLQTASDDYTSSIRFYYSALNQIRAFKKREESAKSTLVNKDKIGYLLMDVSEGQQVSAKTTQVNPDYEVYPNPANDFIYINKAGQVKVFNIFGELLIDQYVTGGLNIDMLPAGTYLLKVNGDYQTKLVKL